MTRDYPQRIRLGELLSESATTIVETLTGESYTNNHWLTHELHTRLLGQRAEILSAAGDSFSGMPWVAFIEATLPTTGFEVALSSRDKKRHQSSIVAADTALKALLTANSYYDGSIETLDTISIFGSFYDNDPSFSGSTYLALSFKQSSLCPVGPYEGTQYEYHTHATEGLVYHIDAFTITNPLVADWAFHSVNRNIVNDYITSKRMGTQQLPDVVRQFTGI